MLLLHGDCLELMKTLPDKSIDLFVCDLPYGCLSAKPLVISNIENRYRKACPDTERKGCAWDIPIDLSAFWVQVKRLCKNDHTPVLMFCSTKFGYELIKSNEDWFRYDLVWNKMRGVSFLMANKMPMRSHELIYVFSKKGANYNRIDIDVESKKECSNTNRKGIILSNTYNQGAPLKRNPTTYEAGKRCPLSIINSSTRTIKGQHPTQKPDDLYEWLITRYSKEGDTILDPTAGSFASCFTAEKLGRKAIGMEMDETFYNKAKSRIE